MSIAQCSVVAVAQLPQDRRPAARAAANADAVALQHVAEIAVCVPPASGPRMRPLRDLRRRHHRQAGPDEGAARAALNRAADRGMASAGGVMARCYRRGPYLGTLGPKPWVCPVDITPMDILAQRQDFWVARPTLRALSGPSFAAYRVRARAPPLPMSHCPSAPGFRSRNGALSPPHAIASACPSHDPARPSQLPRGQHFAGHAGATANLKLTFHPGHSVGANQLAVVR